MKKLLSLFLGLVLSVGLSTTAFASTQETSPYEQILNSINKEFNLTLGYMPVDESKISIEDYEIETRKVATQQRELLDYIATRKQQNKKAILSSSTTLATTSSLVTKTRTKAVWGPYGNYYNITATYNVNGTTVSSLRSAKLGYTIVGNLYDTRYSNPSAPIYSIIDGGRTGTVTIKADLYIIGASYSNVSFYTEFYYNS